MKMFRLIIILTSCICSCRTIRDVSHQDEFKNIIFKEFVLVQDLYLKNSLYTSETSCMDLTTLEQINDEMKHVKNYTINGKTTKNEYDIKYRIPKGTTIQIIKIKELCFRSRCSVERSFSFQIKIKGVTFFIPVIINQFLIKKISRSGCIDTKKLFNENYIIPKNK